MMIVHSGKINKGVMPAEQTAYFVILMDAVGYWDIFLFESTIIAQGRHYNIVYIATPRQIFTLLVKLSIVNDSKSK